MAELLSPDLCIIGAGPGGLALARMARARGASVVLIEKGRLGGSALYAGAVPAHALTAAAERAHAMRTAGVFGIAAEDPKMHFGRLNDHIDQVVAGIAPAESVDQLKAIGVDVREADGRFADRRTVLAGDTQITARRFVIATGSRPAVPMIEGLGAVPFFTTDTVFDATRKLTHLLVIGAGATGLEIGQAYRRLGCMVTVVDHQTALADTDPELREIALRRLREEGVDLHENTEVAQVQARSLGIGVTVRSANGEDQLDVSHILVATGRIANIDDLDLDKAHIRRQRANPAALALSRSLLTSNRRVYAIGGAAGAARAVHATAHQARYVLAHALLGLAAGNPTPELAPRVVFTDPEIAEIGLTEPMARTRLRNSYRVLRAGFAENERARTRRTAYGLVKLITDKSGTVLGAGVVGPQAGELIGLFSLAVANKLNVRQLGAAILPYPSLGAVITRLSEEFSRGQPVSPWLERIMAFNRLFP